MSIHFKNYMVEAGSTPKFLGFEYNIETYGKLIVICGLDITTCKNKTAVLLTEGDSEERADRVKEFISKSKELNEFLGIKPNLDTRKNIIDFSKKINEVEKAKNKYKKRKKKI